MSAALPLLAGRYAVHGEIARGGMAAVHLGRMRGAAGFARVVAVKRLHDHYARDPEFVGMFTDEARLTARIQHPNVVPTLDVVSEGGELLLVMDYVHGETLSRLLAQAGRTGQRLPPGVVATILRDALRGLHAAHEARGVDGQPLRLVHRDVTPQNLLVGVDGVTRVVDFGIAKAVGRLHTTRDGSIKGKLGYMAPEQLYGEKLDRRVDVHAAGVVLWEALVGERLFAGEDDEPALAKALTAQVEPPSLRAPGIPPGLDAVALRAVAKEPRQRFSTALEMVAALEAAADFASPAEVGALVQSLGGERLARRAAEVARLERLSLTDSADEAVGAASAAAPASSAMAGWAPATQVSAGPASTAAPVSGTTASEVAPTLVSARSGELARRPAGASLRKAILAGVLAGGIVLAAGTAAVLAWLRGGEEEASAAPASATANAGAAPGAGAEPGANAKPPAEAGTEASAQPGAVANPATATAPVPAPGSAAAATSTASPATPPTAARPAPSPPPARPAPRPAPKPDCNPPYTINEQGHKRYKRECLR